MIDTKPALVKLRMISSCCVKTAVNAAARSTIRVIIFSKHPTESGCAGIMRPALGLKKPSPELSSIVFPYENIFQKALYVPAAGTPAAKEKGSRKGVNSLFLYVRKLGQIVA